MCATRVRATSRAIVCAKKAMNRQDVIIVRQAITTTRNASNAIVHRLAALAFHVIYLPANVLA